MADPNRIRDLFLAVVDLDPEARRLYLDEHCGDDETRRGVESLLRHHDIATSFLASSRTRVTETPLGELPFEELGEFSLIRELGRGGMGVVYLAIEKSLLRNVALKTLPMSAKLSRDAGRRFEQEARIAAKLRHPAIVPIHRFGSDKGVQYIASELIEGQNLSQALMAQREFGIDPPWQDPRGAARMLAPIAEALHFAHERDVIHRDVKPSNIMVDTQGRALLTDFGLAKDLSGDDLTRSGDLAGTFPYMSPEQALAKRVRVDHRSDVFSLGVVIYETVAGRRPFDGESSEDVLHAITFSDPPSMRSLHPTLPREIEIICGKALEKRPEDRYATAAQLALDLHAFAVNEPIQARPPGPIDRIRRFARRRPAAVVSSLAAIAALGLGLWIGFASQQNDEIAVAIDAPVSSQVWASSYVLGAEFAPATPLGRTPVRTKLSPGLHRFVVRSDDGRFIELSRHLKAGQEELALVAEFRDTDIAIADMALIEADSATVGIGGRAFGYPRMRTFVPSFYLDRDEVTIGEFEEFLEASGWPRPPNWPDSFTTTQLSFPAINVSYVDARAFAEWKGKRLPTRNEWERAARGTDGRSYPWGDEEVTPAAVRQMACVGRTDGIDLGRMTFADYLDRACAVATHPDDATVEGVYDMLGGASEWVDSPAAKGDSLRVELSMLEHVVKGSNWSRNAAFSELQGVLEVPWNAAMAELYIGFRCARSADVPSQD